MHRAFRDVVVQGAWVDALRAHAVRRSGAGASQGRRQTRDARGFRYATVRHSVRGPKRRPGAWRAFRSVPVRGTSRRGAVLAREPLDCLGRPVQRGSQRDRKSTRLNSSHVRISYAVFCLKKKKKNKKRKIIKKKKKKNDK